MKKLVNMFLIALMLLALTGCEIPWLNPNPEPDPDTETPTEGLNQEDLWDFLKNKCFITEYGILDYAYYFKGGDEFVISADHLNYGESYYFSDLIDFKYDGNNTYILEYENHYDAFPHGIFVLIFDPKESNRLTIYQDMYGDRVSVDLFEDEPLNVEEVMAIMKRYNYWYFNAYTGSRIDDYYFFIDEYDEDVLTERGSTSFGRVGDIVDVEYLGVTLYNIKIYYHGMPERLDFAYDDYYSTNQMAISPYVDFIGYNTEMKFDDLRFFYPETGLTLEQLFEDLNGRTYYGEERIYNFEIRDDGTYHIVVDNGFKYWGIDDWQVKDFKFIGSGSHRYELKLAYLGMRVIYRISYDYREPEHMYIDAFYLNGDYQWYDQLVWD
ncbi:MAG: hypothetical protein ACOX1L_00980 [Erysipelotrichaceae bacterium]